RFQGQAIQLRSDRGIDLYVGGRTRSDLAGAAEIEHAERVGLRLAGRYAQDVITCGNLARVVVIELVAGHTPLRTIQLPIRVVVNEAVECQQGGLVEMQFVTDR